MKFSNSWRTQVGALAVAGLMAVTGAVPAIAQQGTPAAGAADLTGSPVTLNDGSCQQPIIEPEFEVGQLEAESYTDAVDDLVRDDIVATDPDFADVSDDVGFVDEDVNDDGILDDDEDINDNDVIDVGLDMNDNGILDDDEIVDDADAAVILLDFPTVWTASEEVDATFEELFGADEDQANESEDDDALDDPGIVAVHQSSENFGDLVACGELTNTDWQDEDQVVIGLHPVGDAAVYGYAVFERDTGNFPVFGENTTGVTVYLFQNLSTLRTERMAGATPTP